MKKNTNVKLKGEEIDILMFLCSNFTNEFKTIKNRKGLTKLLDKIDTIHGKMERSKS